MSEEKDMRGLSRCWQNFGWHVYSAGPCFDRYERALEYRDKLDERGITWKSQDEGWGMYPVIARETADVC